MRRHDSGADMSQGDNARAEFPPPFPLTKPEDWQPMPPRPWIVWAYLVTEVVAVVYGVLFDVVAREHFSLFNLVWSLVFTSIAVLVIWNASRIGWSIFAVLAVLLLPFTFAFLDQGAWGKGSVVIQCISLGILVNPWMFRWIWRDGRPVQRDADDRAAGK